MRYFRDSGFVDERHGMGAFRILAPVVVFAAMLWLAHC